ncbi:hypothetical protein HS088_TW02G01004 [Tripterygium wilfordii]|uniref:BZIP domain-containing protein n=1 Tax=Tripterygium wilfordii TaxID=458696 RepID=A0A7J7E052_TRIWF|nr:basic leucine zipper 43-like [Tripterygium wilfordii]KAF5751985.1 hypothetical protein HS088_TW02G01004 [Tripterygium wilfordii]
MLSGDNSGLHFSQQENQIPNFGFGLMQSNNTQYSFNFHEFTQQSSTTVSNNSTSDEADDLLQQTIIDERKQRRMISNRESARRSRMRKQKHLDELCSQVVRLRTENHSLIDQLNHVSERIDKVGQENSKLKEEASDLRQMLTDLHIGSPTNYSTVLRVLEVDEVPCSTAEI